MLKNFSNRQLAEILRKELKLKKITLKDGINKTKNWDSINNMNILLKLETKFKIRFSSREFNSLNDVKSILENVSKKIK
tara:strand:- start:400 stop:636 length:237 start_codon:yes stop_codon:yes gene_type:complete